MGEKGEREEKKEGKARLDGLVLGWNFYFGMFARLQGLVSISLSLLWFSKYHIWMLIQVKAWIMAEMKCLCMIMRWFWLINKVFSKHFRVSDPVLSFVQLFWVPCGHFQAKCSTRKLFHYGSSLFLFNFRIFGWV